MILTFKFVWTWDKFRKFSSGRSHSGQKIGYFGKRPLGKFSRVLLKHTVGSQVLIEARNKMGRRLLDRKNRFAWAKHYLDANI